ncbi:hypothetical protein [Absidia glauca]|uniref:SH3 domain-containing protein n=1 Tax=Absidia glauca TaxID=4829 RepID=A0A163LZ14_ABSGL|nr:hypothetical protein [Absidia glauca]
MSDWDEHHYGVNVICERLSNAKQTCEEIKKLYHDRSQMEGDYGDRLLKLSQLIVGQDEDGTLAESLSHIPSALETTARAHMDLAQQLQHHLHSPLDSFINEQKDLYTTKQQEIQTMIKAKEASNEELTRTKEAYVIECTKLNEIYHYLQEEYTTATKEERTQAEADRDACLQSIERAEQDYRQSIDTHNSNVQAWVNQWQITCDMYQQLEEKRIRFVRSSLWAFANMMSSVYIVDDQCCERIRTALELTDVDKDIHTFVEKHGTGRSLPDLVEFETCMPPPPPLITTTTHQPMDFDRQNSIETKTLPSMPTAQRNLEGDDDKEDVSSQRNIVHTHQDDVSTPPLSSSSSQQEPPKKRQSEAMAFAAQAIENMLLDDAEKNKETPVTLSEHKLAPQHLPSTTHNDNDNTHTSLSEQPPSQPIANTVLLSLKKEPTDRPSSVKSTESGTGTRFKPVPNPTFARTSQPVSAPPAIPSSPTADHDNNSNNKTTATITEDSVDPPLAELISAAALVTEGNHSHNNDPIHLTDDDDDDGDNDNDKPSPMRPPPKDEKWVISSIRRPQMVPVRSPNARTTTPRGSMIIPTDQQQPSPESNVNTSRRPHPPLKIEIPHKNETQAAAKEAVARGRAHRSSSPQQKPYPQDEAGGIRPPPWQQQEEQRHLYANVATTQQQQQRYSHFTPPQQQQQPLQRYGSVSGPRAIDTSPKNTTTTTTNNATPGNKASTNEFSKFMKGVLKSDRPPVSSIEPQETSAGSKKSNHHGRFSLGIFGNAKKDKQRGESPQQRQQQQQVHQQPQQQQQQRQVPKETLISGPPGGIHTASNPSLPMETVSIPPTKVLHYARAVWSFTATIPMEMSFSAGDRLAIVKKQADGWWEAELTVGATKTRGLVPGNYMESEV